MQSVSFAQGPLFKRLLMFSLPLIAANVLQYLYQFVDMSVVGFVVGESGLVAVSNASSVVFVINSVIIGLTTGGSIAIAHSVGAEDLFGQQRALVATLIVSILGAACMAISGVLGAHAVFTAMNIPKEALEGASSYIVITCTASILPFLMNTATAFLRAQGKGALPLLLVALSAVLNIALDFVFVAALNLGVPGAAWATVASQGVAAFAAFVLIGRRYTLRLRSAARAKIYSAITDVLRSGLPVVVQTAVINLSYVLVTGLLNAYGTEVAAAAGVGLKVSTLAGLPCWAIGSAITTATAQCMGARSLGQARRVIKQGLVFNISVVVFIQIMVQLCAPQLVLLLGVSSPEIIDLAVLYLRITCSVNGVFYAALYSFDSFALGAGFPKLALVNSLIDAFAGRFGMALLFSGACFAALDFGYVGIFVAQAAAPVLPAVIGGLAVGTWLKRARNE